MNALNNPDLSCPICKAQPTHPPEAAGGGEAPAASGVIFEPLAPLGWLALVALVGGVFTAVALWAWAVTAAAT